MQADATRLRRLRLLTGVSLFFAALAFYLSNLMHLAPCSFVSNNGPFLGGDTYDIAVAMRHLELYADMQKHLLFSVVTRPLVKAVGGLLGVDQNAAIVFVLAAIAATAVHGGCSPVTQRQLSTRCCLPLFTVSPSST
jgi:hypothetical protein